MHLAQQIEQTYKIKMKEDQEKYRTEMEDIKKRNIQLEREVKQYSDRMDQFQKSHNTDQTSLEKKNDKMYEDNRRLQEELDSVKSDRETKVLDFQKQQEKDREYYKQKMRDIESKGTMSSAKHTELIMGFEKERTKWESEKGYLIKEKEDASDESQRLGKKVEQLLKDNEKYKNDLRNKNRSMYQAAQHTSNYQAAAIGSKLLSNIGNIGGGYKPKDATKFIGDGGKDSEEKSFTSSGPGMSKQQLESSLIKGIMSTPSSAKSGSESSASHGLTSPGESHRK